MAFGIDTIIARIEWLEKHLRALAGAIDAVRHQVGLLKLNDAELAQRDGRDREGEIVLVRPVETIGMASFTEAVTGPPYQEARIVPDTGQARVWYTYSPATGELRARDTTRRWDPVGEDYTTANARVTVDNINPSEEIPSTVRYIVCVRRGGRLVALIWECDPS